MIFLSKGGPMKASQVAPLSLPHWSG